MKNRKLFAILTLVAFMMTLLPMAAFAADFDAGEYASELEVVESIAEAGKGEDEGAEFKLFLFENDGKAVGATDVNYVYIVTDRFATDEIYLPDGEKDHTWAASDGGKMIEVIGGELEFFVQSNVPGTGKVYVGLSEKVLDYAKGVDNVSKYDAKLIGVEEFTIESAGVKGITVDEVVYEGPGGADTTISNPGSSVLEGQYVPANGFDYYEVTFFVYADNAGNLPVRDQEVTVSANKSTVRFNKKSDETDRFGKATFKVYANEAGTYTIKAKAGKKDVAIDLQFGAPQVYDIKIASEPEAKIDKNSTNDFDVTLYDVNGKVIDLESTTGLNFDYEWVTYPNKKPSTSFGLSVDNGNAEITTPSLKDEGKYELKVALDNGRFVVASWEVKEQGDIVDLAIKYDVTRLALGAVSDEPEITRYDAEGVASDVPNTSGDLTFYVSDNRMLATGYQNINNLEGVVYATYDDDYVGTLVVTVIDKDNNLTASTEILIGEDPIAMEFEVPEKVLVDKDVDITVNVVDEHGTVVGFGSEANVGNPTFHKISTPDDSIVSVDYDNDWAADMKAKGSAVITVASDKVGTAKIQVVFDVDGKTFSKLLTVEFVEEVEKVAYGAKNVTMFIGSTGFVADGVAKTMDQAPFVNPEDNRTYVPVRMVAEALGATNADTMWDPATQTITLVRPDKTVSMTIGSNILTVSDGDEPIVADAAPYIVAETGRTVIPFRAIAEAFGATVEAVFNADGTTNAVTFTQE